MKTIKINMITLAFVFFAISLNAQSGDLSDTETSLATTIDNKDLKWLPAPDFFPDCSFTILHGDMSKPNLDFFFKIEPNTEVVNHTHNSPERMILISGDLEVQYEGEKPCLSTDFFNIFFYGFSRSWGSYVRSAHTRTGRIYREMHAARIRVVKGLIV